MLFFVLMALIEIHILVYTGRIYIYIRRAILCSVRPTLYCIMRIQFARGDPGPAATGGHGKGIVFENGTEKREKIKQRCECDSEVGVAGEILSGKRHRGIDVRG